MTMLDPLALREGGYLTHASQDFPLKEFSTFTCCHCNRVVVKHPQRRRPRHTCLKCNAWTCDSAGCVTECNPVAKDLDAAMQPNADQPFLLRDAQGYPVQRIVLPDGNAVLVRQKDRG